MPHENIFEQDAFGSVTLVPVLLTLGVFEWQRFENLFSENEIDPAKRAAITQSIL